MPEAATPEAGTAPKITGKETAIAAISQMLNKPAEPQKLFKPAEKSEKQATPEKQPEPKEATPEPEPQNDEHPSPEGEAAEGQPEPTGEGGELPEYLDDFARALEMEPEEFLSKIKAKVKIDGQEEEVTLAEALKGHQREADYTRKTMQLAEARRQADAAQQQAQQNIAAKLADLDTAIRALESLGPKEPSQEELDQLYQEDPAAYMRTIADITRTRQQREAAVAKAREEHRKAVEELRQRAAETFHTHRTEQQRLLMSRMPELQDATKRREFETKMHGYLKSLGYSDKGIAEWVQGPWNHLDIMVIRDAMRFREFEKGAKDLPKKLASLPKVTKPGASQGKASPSEKLAALRNQLRGAKTDKKAQATLGLERVRIALAK